PFWPSLDPWAKLTPPHVVTRMARIHQGGRSSLLAGGGTYSSGSGIVRFEATRRIAAGKKPKRRGDKKRKANTARLGQLEPSDESWSGKHAIGHADSKNGTDQRVGAGDRQSKPPGPEVPGHSRRQERQHHDDRGLRGRVDEQIHGQKVDNAEGDRGAADEDPC